MRSVKLLIAGAGPCGLGAALEMMESGPETANDFLIVDPAQQAGGWASSRVTEEGFTFDFGGHVLFPHKHYARFGQMLKDLPISWAASVPQRGVQVEGCFLPYPAQRNLQRLPLHKLILAVGSVLKHRFQHKEPLAEPAQGEDRDMGTYLNSHFGRYIVKLLMGPLNRKQWAHAPEKLTSVWATHRSGSATRNVADMNLGKTLRNLLLGEDDLGWTPDTQVTYPAQGGSGAIWSAVARAIPAEKMMLKTRIVEISLENKTALLSTGETIAWEQMVSTMPLDALLHAIPERPELAEKSKGLVKARSRLFGFGIRGELPARYVGLHSCQVTDADVPFWRMNFPMTVAQGNGPDGCYSVLCEISEPAGEPAESAESLRKRVTQSLRRMGLIERSGQEVISTWEYTIEHGYPVPFLGRDALLNQIQPELEEAGVYSRGRFGTWRYEISNQDHAYMQGVEAVRRILFRIPEETFGNAVAVNEVAKQDKEPIAIEAKSEAMKPVMSMRIG